MKRAAIVLCVVIGFTSATTASEPSIRASDGTGRLCLAAAPTPTTGPRSLGNPTGELPNATYSIRVDGGSSVELSRSSGTWVVGLPLNQRHSIAVLAAGTQIESFYFRFEPSDTTELCLFMKPLYQTWILWPLAKTGPWCSCGVAPAD